MWNLCKDKLPSPLNLRVLIYAKGWGVKEAWVAYIDPVGNIPNWKVFTGSGSKLIWGDGITHWRRIPKPPKEKLSEAGTVNQQLKDEIVLCALRAFCEGQDGLRCKGKVDFCEYQRTTPSI
jgi:hypothetical protein